MSNELPKGIIGLKNEQDIISKKVSISKDEFIRSMRYYDGDFGMVKKAVNKISSEHTFEFVCLNTDGEIERFTIDEYLLSDIEKRSVVCILAKSRSHGIVDSLQDIILLYIDLEENISRIQDGSDFVQLLQGYCVCGSLVDHIINHCN